MKIFICCSKAFYGKVDQVKRQLEAFGHQVTLPNSYDNPGREDEVRQLGVSEHAAWKSEMLREQNRKIAANDAIVVLNFEKHGQANYIGGATFLEIYKAFELGKSIYLYNQVPDGLLRDEVVGMSPQVLNGDLSVFNGAML